MLMMVTMLKILHVSFLLLLIPGRMVVCLKMISPTFVFLVLLGFQHSPLTFGRVGVVGTWTMLVVVLDCPWTLANGSKS